MNLVIVSGPPSSGKTSVILKTCDALKNSGHRVGVVKFDCLHTDDDKLYAAYGIPVKKVCQVPSALIIFSSLISKKLSNGASKRNWIF